MWVDLGLLGVSLANAYAYRHALGGKRKHAGMIRWTVSPELIPGHFRWAPPSAPPPKSSTLGPPRPEQKTIVFSHNS